MWFARRLLTLAFGMALAISAVFFLLRVLPGDAIQAQMLATGASVAAIDERRTALGLDAPIFQQYIDYWIGLMRGDFGVSLVDGQPVLEVILNQLDSTLMLAISALITATALGLLLGCGAALGGRTLSRIARLVTGLAVSVPIYWTGTMAMFIFAAQLRIFSVNDDGTWRGLVLPSAVLGFHIAGAIARVTWATVSDILGADFVRTARGKGLREYRVILWHILHAGIVPILSVIALQAGFLLGGVVITEALFSRPGLGRLLMNAALGQDYPVVQGIVVWSAFAYGVVQLAFDAAAWLLDARLRHVT